MFIVVEGLIQFLGWNIECFEYLSHVHGHLPTGELFCYQWSGFHQVVWEGLQIFLNKFLVYRHNFFPIFKLLNPTVINTFKA